MVGFGCDVSLPDHIDGDARPLPVPAANGGLIWDRLPKMSCHPGGVVTVVPVKAVPLVF